MTRQPKVRTQRQRWYGRSASATFVALAMLGSASCSASSPDPALGARSAPSTSSAPATSPSTSSSPPSSEVGPSDSLGFDTSHQLTQAETMVLYRQSLAQTAKDMNLKNPPEVGLVRFIDPSELSTTLLKCLNDHGLPAKAKAGGTTIYIPGDVPDSQGDFINETQYTCEAMYPIHPQFELPPSPATQGRIYDWLVTKQMPCYRAQGFPVPDPPSKAVWVAAFNAGPTWGPDDSIPQEVARNATAMAELNRKCPPPYPADVDEYLPVIKK